MTYTPPKIQAPYNYDPKVASDNSAIGPGGPSLTVQSMADDTDLNVLMKRFGVTGTLPQSARIPQYGDFDHITDFRSALEAVENARADFAQFPADFRARFDNNPQLLLDFAQNPENNKQIGEWLGEYKREQPKFGVSGGQGAQGGSSGGSPAAPGDGGAGGADGGAQPGGSPGKVGSA